MIERLSDLAEVRQLIEAYAVTTIVGPRLVGKTCLSQLIAHDHHFSLETSSGTALPSFRAQPPSSCGASLLPIPMGSGEPMLIGT